MEILEKITNKELTPIGWGTGLMFRHRRSIHDFDVAFTIHTSKSQKSINKIPIFQPEILDTLDRSSHILIVYTVDYLEYIYDYCRKFDDLLVLPFNEHRLGIKNKLKTVTKYNSAFQNWGIFYENFGKADNAQ